MIYSHEHAQEEMTKCSPLKMCKLQASSCIISRNPEQLETFQMFFSQRNNLIHPEILQQISQYCGIPAPSWDSIRPQQKVVTYTQRPQDASQRWKDMRWKFHFYSSLQVLKHHIFGDCKLFRALRESPSGTTHTEWAVQHQFSAKRESNFSQEINKAHYSSVLLL